MANLVDAFDLLMAEITAEDAPPLFPCAKCGKDTLEHVPLIVPTGQFNEDGSEKTRRVSRRICAAATCRNVTETK